MSSSSQQKQAEKTLVDQTNLLPRARLIIVFGTLAFAFLITYADQNGIAVILPTMARDLNAQDTISWAGTSSFVGNTVFQVLYGRLSDIFGRKVVYLSALILLAVGDILCATAKNGPSLYIFRALAGIAMGGINSLTMIIVSDIVTLQQRGYYQGLLGGCIGLGNIIGPFVSAAFAETSSWRNFFYLLGPLAAASAVLSFFLVPSSMPPRKRKETLGLIDYWGIITGSIAIVFFLVPISGGGSYFVWNSPMVIAMLAISAVAFVAFLIVEWKVSRLPVMPLSMFKTPAVSVILAQNFLFGFAYYAALYYLPIYFQNVLGYSPVGASALLVPGAVSMCFFSRTTAPGIIGIVLAILGAGVGNVFQPCLIALQAHSPKAQRAVVISNRNFLRGLGGAVGLAVSAQVMQSSLRNSLPPHLRTLVSSSYSIPSFNNLPGADIEALLDGYMTASHTVFTVLAPFMGTCLLGCFLVKDRGLQRKEEVKEEKQESVQTGESENKDESVEAGEQGVIQRPVTETVPSK
ncbi:Major facilitator superprotein [Pyrenophora tritici-repentis]|nr:Major facilitator superprotein [Pyrenophora tritici-repentis]